MENYKVTHSESEPSDFIENASKLLDIYGYWNAFHDAEIVNVVIDRHNLTVTVELLLFERSLITDTDIRTFAKLIWHEVKELSLEMTDEEISISSLRFFRDNKRINTIFLSAQMSGSISSMRVEVLEVRALSE